MSVYDPLSRLTTMVLALSQTLGTGNLPLSILTGDECMKWGTSDCDPACGSKNTSL